MCNSVHEWSQLIAALTAPGDDRDTCKPASGPDGATAYVDADPHDPETILAAATEVLDFSRPVAVILVAILQHISDQDDPHGIVNRLAADVPSGSYLALSHPARDIQAAASRRGTRLGRGPHSAQRSMRNPRPGRPNDATPNWQTCTQAMVHLTALTEIHTRRSARRRAWNWVTVRDKRWSALARTSPPFCTVMRS
jgi:S-adenosyl methyltransferase